MSVGVDDEGFSTDARDEKEVGVAGVSHGVDGLRPKSSSVHGRDLALLFQVENNQAAALVARCQEASVFATLHRGLERTGRNGTARHRKLALKLRLEVVNRNYVDYSLAEANINTEGAL